jgi:hypothetical protein
MATSILTTKSTYRSLSAQQLSERTIQLLWSNWNVRYLLMARYLVDCTPWPRSKQRVWHTLCKSNYRFIRKQKTDMTKLGRKTKQLWWKKFGYRTLPWITHRDNGRGMSGVSLSSKEQWEPYSHEAQRSADSLHLPIAPARHESLLLNWPRSMIVPSLMSSGLRELSG